MAKILFCAHCLEWAAITEAKPKECATCGNPVEWRETDGFTLTLMDRKLLASFKISAS